MAHDAQQPQSTAAVNSRNQQPQSTAMVSLMTVSQTHCALRIFLVSASSIASHSGLATRPTSNRHAAAHSTHSVGTSAFAILGKRCAAMSCISTASVSETV